MPLRSIPERCGEKQSTSYRRAFIHQSAAEATTPIFLSGGMAIARGESVYPLGDLLYLTVSVFRGAPIVRIRKSFKTVQCTVNSARYSITPTHVGVTVSHEQLMALYTCLPLAIVDMEQRTPSSIQQQQRQSPPSTSAEYAYPVVEEPCTQGSQGVVEELKSEGGDSDAIQEPPQAPARRRRGGIRQ